MTAPNSLFAEPRIEARSLPDGGMVLRSEVELGPLPRATCDYLRHWAERAPNRTFLAERRADGSWRRIGYAEARAAARAIGQALLERELGPARPLMILSENGIDHALLTLGALEAGVPAVPVSTAYSLLSKDFQKLRYIADLVEPGMVYAADGARYVEALKAINLKFAEIVVSQNPPAGFRTTPISALLRTGPGAALEAASRAVGPDTVAKILFTSGSTGDPKGVINTQRMLCANQESIALVWPFVARRPPVLVDWLPWNHTFGGNHDINLVLRNGGAFYIDEGKPMPGLIERTAANLKEVSPTLYLNVPRGYAMLLDHLERDSGLAENFFRELDAVFYAAAALPQSLWERIERLSEKVLGRRVPMISAWGATETAPMATSVHYPIARAGNVGVPAPGWELKLVPNGGRLEVRVRGANVTPGYFRRPDLTEQAFDAEGFYCPGDAMRLEDPRDPTRGLVFDGRIAENFKLSTGSWVSVGALRVAAIAACAPLMEDGVLTGHDRDEAGLLMFPSLAGCRSLCPHLPKDAPLATLVREPAVRAALAEGLRRLNAAATGSSQRIGRALLMTEPPSIDRGEITDKGYLNQRACLTHRAELVERLHSDPPPEEVVLADRSRL
ncbi:MAG TPA: feruloyl-CoA synthase [Stellaceae bacterium]|nr:feruloyl-CoA synthase [Stellaceae bacterium]